MTQYQLADRTLVHPYGISLALFVCSNGLYIPYLVRPSGSSNVQGFQTAVILCAYASAVSVAHHNRESVDYIADTTLRFLSSVSPYLLAVPHQIRVVVINSQVSPRHATVPVNLLCRTLSLNTSSCLKSARSLLAYQSNHIIFLVSPDISAKNTPCNCTSH